MKNKINHFIIIGSSKGLGAALVDELLKNKDYQIVGVARTQLENIEHAKDWITTSRYKHVELDISSPNACEVLKKNCSNIKDKRLCVIFNAAYIDSDTRESGFINFDILKKINATGINGLCATLEAFEKNLIKKNGMFVGISSFSVFVSPVLNPKVSYPATKAYLDVLLNSLRALWGNKVKIITIHLGNMRKSEQEGFLSKILAPSYSTTAGKIISFITADNNHDQLNYPPLYTFAYKYILRLIPQSIAQFLLKFVAKYLGDRISSQENLK